MAVVINGDTGISPVTASGTSASVDGMTVGRGGGEVSTNTAVGVSALGGGSQTGVQNTSVGYQSMLANTSGSYNAAFGHQAMAANTTGEQNAAFGREALLTNTTGNFNAASGMAALRVNTTGSNNTAFGFASLYLNTTASNNTAVGYQAGYSNTTGADLVAVGKGALYAATTGNSNTAVGNNALTANTTASNNTAVGDNAGAATTTGANNTIVGKQALQANTTASNNTAVGYQAGYSNTTGGANTSVGQTALYSNTTGINTVAIGSQAGYSQTSFGANTFVGFYSGYSTNNTGAYGYNTFVGYGSGQNVTTGIKNSILGAYNGNQGSLDIRTASNYIVLSDGDGNPRLISDSSGYIGIGCFARLGNGGVFVRPNVTNGAAEISWNRADTASSSDILTFYNNSGQVGKVSYNNTSTTYSTSSDYRLKNTIAPMTGALAKVAQLNPVTYKWNADGSDGQGFIAHELAAVCPDAVLGTKDAVDADGNPVYQGIDTSFLVATLTAAIKEQQAIITQLTERITALEGA